MLARSLFVLALVFCLGSQPASAQRPGQKPPTGKPANKQPNKKDGQAKPGEKKEGADKKEAVESVKRPEKPPRPPDPREFEAKPDERGLVNFNFYGQSWPDLVQWLAKISNYSLDWQELPKDYVNITTSRPYTVPEIHDLFNRLLLERGFTMVKKGRILAVNRIEKIDPSLLVRVDDESELLDLPAHELVKITFHLPEKLKADQVAADIKFLLSPHAKVHPLVTTNRLLVIDAVINLREASQLINAEHLAAASHLVPTEFKVHFARADRVADQVMILLGLDPSTRRTPQELQVETQRLQLFRQMQQKGKDISKYLRKGDGPQVHLAVNHRNNSILANAPPAELKIIKRAIEQLDVPTGGLAAGATSASPAMSMGMKMEKYKLVAISPEAIVTALEEIGDLDPRTRFRTDVNARVVFAHATEADHLKIKSMIDNLDGTGRQLEVVWLRRLPAESVAATLHKLMVGEKEEDDNNRRGYYYFGYSRRNQNEVPKGEFRVDADVERNRLLLWANDAEMVEVRRFLEKLGEIPGRSGNPHTVRYIEPRTQEATVRLLEQLQKHWKGRNQLLIETPEPEAEEPTKTVIPPAEASLQVESPYRFAAQITTDKVENSGSGSGRQRAMNQGPPPITITVDREGRITLSSNDTVALDELEDLMNSLTPPAPNYEVFYLKYAFASMVTLNLEEYFEEEETFDTQDNWMRAWYGFDFESSKESGTGLSARKQLRFIYDFDTNSILVSNASPSQLETVRSLIDIYDKPPSEESISARSFQIFKLEFSQADAVAKTIKEVYRDLLSSKDKDFQNKGEQKQTSQTTNYYRISGSTDDNSKKTKVKASFEGALSVGVDPVSNTVIVSAQEEWMPSIARMIEYLDENARPDRTVAVQRVATSTSASSLQETLAKLFTEPEVSKTQDPNQKKNGQQQQGQANRQQGKNGQN